MPKLLVRLTVLSIINVFFAGASFADVYNVHIEESYPRLTKVTATIEPNAQIISMNEQNAHGLKNGWSGFIRNIKAVDDKGKDLKLVSLPDSKWKVIGHKSGNIKLSYDAILGHDAVIPKIKFGDNGAAYATDDGVMWAGRALFIAGKPSDDVTVKFDIPEGWNATTQWTPIAKQENAFKAEGTQDLQNSAFFAGTHSHDVLKTDSITLNMAFSGKYTQKIKDDIVNKVSLFFDYYGARYQSSLKSRMVLIVSDRNDGGGEVMGKAISISIGPRTKKQLNIVPTMPPGVSRLIAHELFHGFAFNLLEVDDKADNAYKFEWFNEGFGAEYSSQLALLKTGIKSEASFLHGIVYRMKEYESEADGKLTLLSAGKDKSNKSTTIYWGGLMAAMTLDFQIRNQSNGRKNIDELWKYLLKQHPKGEDSLTLDKLYAAANKLFGESIALDLKRYVNDPAIVPFYDAASLMGLSFDGKKMYRNKGATRKQKELWKNYLSPNKP